MNNNKINSKELSPKKIGLAGKMARLFVQKKELNILSILFIITIGIASFIIIPKSYNPNIVAPAFMITTNFPGARAVEVQELITKPMENVISELTGIDQLTSHSFDGGQSLVMAQFKVGTSAEKAKISLSQKLRDNMDRKPLGAHDPEIVTMDPDDIPIITIGLKSSIHTPQALRTLAFDLADELKLIEGTSKISIVGGKTDNINVILDAEKMAHFQLEISDIIGAIRSANGAYINSALKNEQESEIIRINGNTSSVEEIEKIVIAPNLNQPLTLSDVSLIEKNPGEINNSVRLSEKNQPAQEIAYVTIAKLKGANIGSVTEAIQKKLSQLEKESRFSSVNFLVLRDDGKIANKEISTLTKHLILSVAIVVIILMAFLGIRNSLIVAISIPLTLLISFIVGIFADQTINRITLFALILALGLLVDDAIVIIENIHRTIKNNPGKNKSLLIIQAVDEVGMGVFMSTITILLAFIPMAFVGGMMGPYMQPIPFFVSITLLASLLIAFTVNPALAGIFSSHKIIERENIFLRSIHKIENGYAKIIGILTNDSKKRNLILWGSLLILLFALMLPAFKIVKFRMLPKADKDHFYIYLDMPQTATYNRTNEIAKKIEYEILNTPNIESLESFIATPAISDFNGLFKGSFLRSQENQATLKINLIPHDTRKESSETVAFQLREKLIQKVLISEPDAKITVVEDPPGPPVRSTFFLKIQGENPDLIATVTKDLERLVQEIPGIVDIANSVPQRSLEKQYQIDIEKAGRLGIAPLTITETLTVAFSGSNIARFSEQKDTESTSAEQQFIFLRLDQKKRTQSEDLKQITVRSFTGQSVPISELLIEKNLEKTTEITTDQRQQTMYISGEMGNRSVMYAVLDFFPKLFNYKLPDNSGEIINWSPLGVTYENFEGEKISIKIDGEWKLTLEIFRDLGIAMAMALLLIYFVLVLQLKSLGTPLLIMATIPLALIGVLFGFALLGMIRGTYFNATSMIGVIALAGIVVKNAIIYLAYLDELKQKNIPLNEALMEAGRVRLLPIILTSLTAILGSLTIITDPVWEGLAWAIIFGLSVSTILTLIVFPLLYQTFEKKKWD